MKTNIVKFVGFLVANICHDEQEWQEWAVPFIEMLLIAQKYSKEEQKSTLAMINEMFATLFGSKTKLVCEEGDGFIVLHVGSVWWEEACAQDKLEEELSEFLNNYITWTTTSGVYDARARVVAKRMYYVLQTPEKFAELESRIRGSSNEKAESAKVVVSGLGESAEDEEEDDVIMSNKEDFKHGSNVKHTRKKTFSSDVVGGNVTERIWKVSLAATVGASIMSVAAISTGPAIVGAILATLGDTTLAQFFVGMTAVLTSYGVTSSSVMGTLGAYTATMKMLHRTEPLKEFRISHLHRAPDRRQTEPAPSGLRFSQDTKSAPSNDGNTSCFSNAPIYMLVPGHCNYIPASESSASGIASSVAESLTGPYRIQSDRDVWGADPTDMADMEILEPEGCNESAPEGSASMLGKVTTIIDYFNASSGPPAGAPTGSAATADSSSGSGEGTSPRAGSVEGAEKRAKSASPPGKVDFLFETEDRYGAYESSWAESAGSILGPSDVQLQLRPIIKNAEPLKPEAFTGNDINKNWDFVSYDNVHHGWWGDQVHFGDEYLLQWDRSSRDHLSRSLHEYISSKGVNYITHELLMLTPAASLLTASALPWPLNMMHKSLNEIDNPWSIAIEKSRKAGHLLAITLLMQHETFEAERKRALQQAGTVVKATGKATTYAQALQSMSKALPPAPAPAAAAETDATSAMLEQLQQVLSSDKDIQAAMEFITLRREAPEGQDGAATGSAGVPQRRPITLIGYGIGARVIVHCLETLVTEYKQYANKDFIRGLVENVVLMGTPFGTNAAAWRELRSIIPGRFINCYSTRDWLLALMFRQCTWELGVAGLSPIDMSGTGGPHTRPAGVPAHTDDANEGPTDGSGAGPASTSGDAHATSEREADANDADDDVFNIENVDISALIRSHADYPNALQLIIPLLRLEE
jgi:hypothetical protein